MLPSTVRVREISDGRRGLSTLMTCLTSSALAEVGKGREMEL